MGEAVRIPKDPEARARLAEFAGLTEEERHAIDLWCAEQAREDDAKRRRGLEAHGNDPMASCPDCGLHGFVTDGKWASC